MIPELNRLREMSSAWSDAAGAALLSDDPAYEEAMGRFRKAFGAMPSARAATPSGLSQSPLASCQHRIAIAGEK